MALRAFRLLPASRLRALEALLRQGLAPWADTWGVPLDALRIEAQPASARPSLLAQVWREALECDGRRLWTAWQDDLASQLRALMFPSPPHGTHGRAPIAESVAAEALGGLAGGLRLLLGGPTAATLPSAPASELVPGSGAVLLTLALAKAHCQIVLNHAAVEALVPMTPVPLAPPVQVDPVALLAQAPVSLQVLVGTATAPLSEWLGLAVGDVVRLRSHLDSPATLCLAHGGAAIGAAYLGRMGDQVAIELTEELTQQ